MKLWHPVVRPPLLGGAGYLADIHAAVAAPGTCSPLCSPHAITALLSRWYSELPQAPEEPRGVSVPGPGEGGDHKGVHMAFLPTPCPGSSVLALASSPWVGGSQGKGPWPGASGQLLSVSCEPCGHGLAMLSGPLG